jgi:PKD repeat protein
MTGLIRGTVAGAIIALLLWGLGLNAQQPFPLIGVEQSINPDTIYFQGSGEPDRATVSLTLRALREQPFPLDLVLVVDRSASSDITAVRKVGEEILAGLGREDRVALVSFADTATLDVSLTWDKSLVTAQLKRLQNVGKTGLGEGLAAANLELIEQGREDAVLVEILLIDGQSNTGREPLPQAEVAARNGILIYAIGIGRYLEADLAEIATTTGGLFFKKYDNDVLNQIFSALYRDLVGSEITITRTLAAGFTYRAISNPPTREVRHGDLTTLEWDLEELAVGGSWSASFEITYTPQVSGRKAVMEIDADPLAVSFSDCRHRQQRLELPALTLTVRGPNRLPQADFEFSPQEPSTRDDVSFKDLSSDPDGTIVAWSWEFGDGTGAAEQSPLHRYARDGTYEACLTVADDDGARSEPKCAELTVFTAKASATREINTYLHVDKTPPGQTFRVTVTITVNMDLNGLGLEESLPADWKVTAVENAELTCNEKAAQWVLVGKIPAGTVKKIVYDVTVPADATPKVYDISGNISSASPSFEAAVEGESQVEITDRLPISWIVSRWDTEKDQLNVQLSDKITFDQIQQAVAWWLEGKVIEHTGGAVIDLRTMEELIAYWLTDTPVYEPLS